MGAVAQVTDVQVELQGVLDVQAGQADLLSQLQKENMVNLVFSVINQEKERCNKSTYNKAVLT